jgi:hypothetical protein
VSILWNYEHAPVRRVAMCEEQPEGTKATEVATTREPYYGSAIQKQKDRYWRQHIRIKPSNSRMVAKSEKRKKGKAQRQARKKNR